MCVINSKKSNTSLLNAHFGKQTNPCNSKYMETCNENINSKIQFDILGTSHNEKKCWKSVLQLLGIKFKQNSKTSEICQQ